MMFDRWTRCAQRALQLAKKEAQNLNHKYLGAEHLLLGLLQPEEGTAMRLLAMLNLDYPAVRREVQRLVGALPAGREGRAPLLTTKAQQVFHDAQQEANSFQHAAITAEHLLLALLKQPKGIASRVLHNLHIDCQRSQQALRKELATAQPKALPLPAPAVRRRKMPALQAYGHDLTQRCREQALEPVIGRRQEIERLLLILGRRRKNNPLLVGEAGVGKTAIVEGLAWAIASGKVPQYLLHKRLIALDLMRMIAGTKYRGQFEERLQAVVREVKKDANIVLFIDELQTIAPEGGADIANILKPLLSRGEMQCIGATTSEEYRKYIEKDAALARRFQKIVVLPPTPEEAIVILDGLKGKYEQHHRCTYSSAAIRAAVLLSERYIGGRFLPDKAIDLIDEAAATGRITQGVETLPGQPPLIIDAAMIARSVAQQTGIPLPHLSGEETTRVLQLEERLNHDIVGQEEAITTICRAIRRSWSDIKDPDRPIGAFLLLGPTGVGKTLLAKQLARHIFGGLEALIQVDMSEYMERFASSRILGAPPGYVGHEEGGQLSEQVRQRPHCVLLLDEVEKAHPEVMHLLLQVLEEGHLSDSWGRKVDFRQAIIIMTSNLGTAPRAAMGFAAAARPEQRTVVKETERAVGQHFKAELINRLDALVVFRPLSKAMLSGIVDLEVRKLQQRLLPKGITLRIDAASKQLLVEKGFQPAMGARALRRAITAHLEDPLAEKLLRHPGRKWRPLAVRVVAERLAIEEAEL